MPNPKLVKRRLCLLNKQHIFFSIFFSDVETQYFLVFDLEIVINFESHLLEKSSGNFSIYQLFRNQKSFFQ